MAGVRTAPALLIRCGRWLRDMVLLGFCRYQEYKCSGSSPRYPAFLSTRGTQLAFASVNFRSLKECQPARDVKMPEPYDHVQHPFHFPQSKRSTAPNDH